MSMIDKSAIDLYQRDARFHAMCQSAVASAMAERRLDLRDEIDERTVYDVALLAAVTALKRAFDGDVELSATRAERDHYKAAALRGLSLAPPEPIILQSK